MPLKCSHKYVIYFLQQQSEVMFRLFEVAPILSPLFYSGLITLKTVEEITAEVKAYVLWYLLIGQCRDHAVCLACLCPRISAVFRENVARKALEVW